MDAVVYQDGRDFFVSLSIAGEEIDVAGPFDDLHDAEMAALRSSREVEREYRPSIPELTWAGGRWQNKRGHDLAEMRADRLKTAAIYRVAA